MSHLAVTLERTIAIAALAHEGQYDKRDEPYILHPLAVMAAVSRRSRRVAVLHDVLEDTDYEPAALEATLFAWEWEALLLLTRPHEGDEDRLRPFFEAMTHWPDRRPRLTHSEYVRRIAAATGDAGAVAREVKVADVRHNSSPERAYPGSGSMTGRYARALQILLPATESFAFGARRAE